MQAKHDEEILKRVFAMIRIPRPSLVLDWTDDFEQLLGTLRASRALLAMRLHACLLAHRLGVPTVGIAYDPKVRQHFRELGIEERALAPGVEVDELVEGLTQVLGLEGKLETPVRNRVAALELAARDGIHSLASALGEAPLVRGAPPIRRAPLAAATAADSKAEEIRELKRALGATKNSLSYSLGNMLVEAVRNPGHNTALLPYRLTRLCVKELRNRKRKKVPRDTGAG
jgi:hypothetical protein